jgi:hypothetical protein
MGITTSLRPITSKINTLHRQRHTSLQQTPINLNIQGALISLAKLVLATMYPATNLTRTHTGLAPQTALMSDLLHHLHTLMLTPIFLGRASRLQSRLRIYRARRYRILGKKRRALRSLRSTKEVPNLSSFLSW